MRSMSSKPAVVNEQMLRESKLVRGNVEGIKILGDGELKHGLKIEADKVSASAREKIEKAGGTITLRKARSKRDASKRGCRSCGKGRGGRGRSQSDAHEKGEKCVADEGEIEEDIP